MILINLLTNFNLKVLIKIIKIIFYFYILIYIYSYNQLGGNNAQALAEFTPSKDANQLKDLLKRM